MASSDSGRTARFGGGSPLGDESFAAPTLLTGPQEERMALKYVIVVPEFVESYIIVDAVMKSLASSLTASNVLRATGTS